MLLGQVKLGTVPSATVLNPLVMKRAMLGIAPSFKNCWKYAGSPPSMHTTTTGCVGQRYVTPLAVTTFFSVVACMPAIPLLTCAFTDVLKTRRPRGGGRPSSVSSNVTGFPPARHRRYLCQFLIMPPGPDR